MSYTLEEIRRQPSDWATTTELLLNQSEQWRQLFAEKNYENLYFTGCGTSYHIAIVAAYLFQEVTSIPCKAVPASEVLLMPDQMINRKANNLLIGVGRSGTTTESVEAIRKFREEGFGDSLSIACQSQAPASAAASFAIELGHVTDRSVVMTGTFTNLVLATQLLAGIVADNAAYVQQLQLLPEIGLRVLQSSESIAERYGSDLNIRQFIYLGLGGYYGLAAEAVLKLKEMTQTPTEAYNPLEFRHGPISIVDANTLVTLFQSDKAPQVQVDVLKNVRTLGGKTLVISDVDTDEPCFALASNVPDTVRAILYMPYAQLVGYHRAIALGLDPDQPRNLSHVVTLSL
ncbi:SIS domain-containing protein [Alicyclobacillus fastidiosus]|uniref:SIS domain-containing protein n=1 Tax=Alicyclobacillus fastidiosus TaxID=392011 RepID=A0ABV5A8Z4_9BACL|nr:SIS domain-containing protein [Alicyclobacillus fastidiosus]WEH10628.1 SIS domain-containing protein [Alicyclobacillus fastidiosus]